MVIPRVGRLQLRVVLNVVTFMSLGSRFLAMEPGALLTLSPDLLPLSDHTSALDTTFDQTFQTLFGRI